jgi:hypothetical protein
MRDMIESAAIGVVVGTIVTAFMMAVYFLARFH